MRALDGDVRMCRQLWLGLVYVASAKRELATSSRRHQNLEGRPAWSRGGFRHGISIWEGGLVDVVFERREMTSFR